MAIYLNNAATTWPKPECVPQSMSMFITQGGANSSRGTSSKRDMSTMNLILDCRMKLAEFFGGYDNLNPLLVTFCMNITEAINTVLHGFLKPGMRVLTSSMEHNAVMRPLRFLEARGVELDILQADPQGLLHPEDLRAKLNESRYDLAIFSHASNVAGTLQPVDELAGICRDNNLPLVLDTAQTAGLIKLNASELGLSA
ncbi:MAG: aminotransferase class V-fold PLP-dependent enzyme, partial [Synergistaceae bacterium]|nr:aminotransferase class V-fold PLP-dependent enzyme [Synergistaceae bacterium]